MSATTAEESSGTEFEVDSTPIPQLVEGQIVIHHELNERGYSYGEVLVTDEPKIVRPNAGFAPRARSFAGGVQVIDQGTLLGIDGWGCAHVVDRGTVRVYDTTEKTHDVDLDGRSLNAYVANVTELRGEWECVYHPGMEADE